VDPNHPLDIWHLSSWDTAQISYQTQKGANPCYLYGTHNIPVFQGASEPLFLLRRTSPCVESDEHCIGEEEMLENKIPSRN